EAAEPSVDTSGTEDNAIAWFILSRADGVDRPIHEFCDFVNDVVKDRIERAQGVSRVNVFGGSERELRVVVDPQQLARYQLTIPEVARILQAESASVSAGDVEEGKRRYAVRSEGELNSVETIERVVLRTRTDPVSGRVSRVTVADIATVDFAFKDPSARIRQLGESSIALNAVREGGANVIETMENIRAAVAFLNAGPLPAQGLTLTQVYDETEYINSSIALVQQNIWVGGLLAAIILLLFLRSPRATLIIAIAIPVSIVGAFVAMAALGRSLNVISLAGIAFAVGMVVDAAIVVLENIFKHRERGDAAADAAYKGASQVWGAILVSALTTVMVFIPILIRDLEVSQLFRDIAVAISVSVLLSLLVSVTLLPALAAKLFSSGDGRLGRPIRLPVIDDLAARFARFVAAVTAVLVRKKTVGAGVVLGVATLAGVATIALAPQLEYLPNGNRNLIIGFIIPPPGYNLPTVEQSA
ncbi:MAG: efflux RND transporter permease subunit, partial [Pseudomonadota bacterium]